MIKVITHQSPSGATIDLTPSQARRLQTAGTWPRDSRGQEFCQVSHGLHAGSPTYTDEQINEMIRTA